jgi:NADH dehydrogenase
VILVTGANGFVGRHIVESLRAAEHSVRCLVRHPSRASRLAQLRVELVQGDMTDPESLRRAVAGCDTVVHLVAVRQGPRQLFERVMERGTRDLVAAARDAGVRRFVHMSALGTNEATKDAVPYFHAKWVSEETVRSSSLDHVIFRPSFVFGPDGGILPTFKQLARLTPFTPILGSGTQRIQPIWVGDVAAYFVRAVDETAATNRTFELGGPDVVSWDQFWERLKRSLGLRRPALHIPIRLMRPGAAVTERLPGNIPLTRDLLTMLELGDNVVEDPSAVETFQVPLVPLDEQLRRGA